MAACQAVGWLFRRLGQPLVVGEMVAGIILGPSLLGWIAPGIHQSLFPESSLGALGQVGQLGIVFYMFLVGATLDLTHLRENRSVALHTSLSGIAVPFAGGVTLGWL